MQNEGLTGQIGRWTAICALFLILATPLIVVNGWFFPFITGKAFFFRVMVEIAFAGWAVLACVDKRYRPQFSWLGALLVVFVLWMLIADIFALNPGKALWSNFERMEGWVTLIHLLALFVVASSILTVGKLWKAFWLTSLGVSVIVSLYCVLQLMGVATIHQGTARVDATLGNAEYLAAYLLFHIFIAGWLCAGEFAKRTWLMYALPVLMLLETYLLFQTQTRGAVLALVGGALLAGLLAAIVSGGKVRRYGIGALIAVLVLIGGFFLARNTSFVTNSPALTRVASISLDQGATRFTLWHMAFEGVAVHPLLGWGQEGYNYVFNQFYEPSLYAQEAWFDRAHNSFIDWLVAGGIPAFLLYIGIFLAAFWLLFARTTLTQGERVGVSVLLVAYAIHSFFVFDNLISSVFFIMVIAYIHGMNAKPVAYLETTPELEEEAGTTFALPIAAVVLLAVLYFVNVPGISAASELIQAISSSPQGPAGQLMLFKDVLSHPAFGAQEAREQLVSFAAQEASDSRISDEDRSAIALYTISEWEKQVAELPQDARLRLELALAYRIAGDDTNALKQDLIAQTLSPNKEDMFVQEGTTRWEAGDTAGAKAAFDKAYALGPSFPDLAVYAAIGNIITGDQKAAQAQLQTTFGTTTVVNETLMLAYYRIKDWPDLIAALKQNVVAQKGSANAMFRLAAAYVNAGDLNAATLEVQAAIAAHPDAAVQGQTLLGQLQAMKAQQAQK